MPIKSKVSSAVLPTAFLFASSLCAQSQIQPKQPNVLFIIADDMRPEFGCYGVEGVKTPNIDALASSGVLFQNAYCNVPVSGASRASLFTGVYPNFPNRFTAYNAMAQEECPWAVPMSGWFVENGYYAVSNGKVFHTITDHDDSWSEYPWRVDPDGYGADWAEYNKWELWMNKESGNFINPATMRGPFCESADVPDTAYDDGKVREKTIDDLKRLKEKDQPFFLACGFWRPHLPFNAPKKYWDMYYREDIALATNRYRPEDLPSQVSSSTEIKSYALVDNTSDIEFHRKAKHGYYACLSYIDAQIGMILQALDDLELSQNTIVVLIGDHGWHLGEHDFWGKHNLMKKSTHSPLIVRAPGLQKGKTASMVEFVDIYPTLCELCNIPKPKEQLDGRSFVPILNNLEKRTKHNLYIQWQGGYSAVSNRYNFAQWPNTGGTSMMLFDHKHDADENKNVAKEPQYKKTVKQMQWFLSKKKGELTPNGY